MFQQNEFDVTRVRKRLGLSQKEMALALNVSEQTIRIWEHDFEVSQTPKKTLWSACLDLDQMRREKSLEGAFGWQGSVIRQSRL